MHILFIQCALDTAMILNQNQWIVSIKRFIMEKFGFKISLKTRQIRIF